MSIRIQADDSDIRDLIEDLGVHPDFVEDVHSEIESRIQTQLDELAQHLADEILSYIEDECPERLDGNGPEEDCEECGMPESDCECDQLVTCETCGVLHNDWNETCDCYDD